MKLNVFLKAMLLVVLVNYTSAAQEVLKVEADSIPVLEEWWRAPDLLEGQYYDFMTYLPNFKDGKGALAIATHRGTHTWMLRYPGDTANIFTWKYLPIVYADFNGDGQRDYMDFRGNIYPGIQNGQPPMNEPVEGNSSTNLGMNSIGDFNGDGFDDMVIARDPQGTLFATLVMGGSDLTKLHVVDIPKPDKDKHIAVGSFQNKQGEWRLVSWWYGNIMGSSYDEGFVLWKMNFTGEGDSLKATVSEINRYKEKGTKLGTYNHYAFGTQIFKNKDDETLMFTMGIVDWKNKYNTPVFSLSNDKIEYQFTFSKQVGAINQSVNGKNLPVYTGYDAGGRVLFSTEMTDTVPRFRVQSCSPLGNEFISIGDINSDGFGDFAVLRSDCFAIVLGQDQTVGIQQNLSNNFSLKTFKTNPSHFTISFTLLKESHATFSLFDMEGKLVKVLKEGMFDAGAQSFTWDRGDMPQGAYLVQLSADGQIATEKILIAK